MEYGDLGKRFVAMLIDNIAVFVIGFILGYVFALAGLLPAAFIIAPFINIIYFTLMEGGSRHATLGKMAMGLYVAGKDGSGIGYSASILRSLGKILSGLVFGIGYIMCFFNEEKQCLHDMIAKTYVLSGKPEDLGSGSRLVCVRGPLAGIVYRIPDGGLVMGRDSKSCQVVLPPSQSNVSRVHCLITYNPISGMFILSDRNSKLGTYLENGRRIQSSSPAALSSGSRFYLATKENMFEVR